MNAVLIFLGIIIVLLVVAGIWRKSTKHPSKHPADIISQLPVPIKEVELLTLKEVVEFFKQEAVLTKMRANENLVAVAIKEKVADGMKIVLCLYNKLNPQVEMDVPVPAVYHAKDIDAELSSVFGDKDMIVLK